MQHNLEYTLGKYRLCLVDEANIEKRRKKKWKESHWWNDGYFLWD